MSSVNYDLSSKSVRLIPSEDAWLTKKRLNYKKYQFIGKIDIPMPNMIVSANDKRKPIFKGDVSSLNNTAKYQIINHFYDIQGKRNKRTVAYIVKPKK